MVTSEWHACSHLREETRSTVTQTTVTFPEMHQQRENNQPGEQTRPSGKHPREFNSGPGAPSVGSPAGIAGMTAVDPEDENCIHEVKKCCQRSEYVNGKNSTFSPHLKNALKVRERKEKLWREWPIYRYGGELT